MARPTTLPPALAALAESLGGVQALADACGVSRRTVQRWGTGEREPSMLERRAIDAMARRRGLAAPFAED